MLNCKLAACKEDSEKKIRQPCWNDRKVEHTLDRSYCPNSKIQSLVSVGLFVDLQNVSNLSLGWKALRIDNEFLSTEIVIVDP